MKKAPEAHGSPWWFIAYLFGMGVLSAAGGLRLMTNSEIWISKNGTISNARDSGILILFIGALSILWAIRSAFGKRANRR